MPQVIPKPAEHFVSTSCGGELCGICLRLTGHRIPATHKIGEEIMHDTPREILIGHNLTQYVCCACFVNIFGLSSVRWRGCESPA